MAKPRAIILTGFGINCDYETELAFRLAGAETKRVHLQDVIEGRENLDQYQITVLPGGFSYGDYVASGKVFATKLKTYGERIRETIEKQKMIGICNGAQIAAKFGLIPGLDDSSLNQQLTLTYNDSGRFECRWVKMKKQSNKCAFTRDVEEIELPVAHGEGKFFMSNEVLRSLYDQDLIVFKYVNEKGKPADGRYPCNPNGSMDDIAAVCDTSGRLLIMMPHPERYLSPYHHPQWRRQLEEGRLPKEGQGLKIFRNIVNQFT